MYFTNDKEGLMEKIVLHVDSGCMMCVDNFVRAICDTNHIGNYYATILVAVEEAVERAAAFEKNPKDGIEVSFDYCPQGVFFRVQGSEGCFRKDDLSLVYMLADGVELSNGSSTLQLSFAIRGIDFDEAAKRVSVLEHFYHPASSKVLQM